MRAYLQLPSFMRFIESKVNLLGILLESIASVSSSQATSLKCNGFSSMTGGSAFFNTGIQIWAYRPHRPWRLILVVHNKSTGNRMSCWLCKVISKPQQVTLHFVSLGIDALSSFLQLQPVASGCNKPSTTWTLETILKIPLPPPRHWTLETWSWLDHTPFFLDFGDDGILEGRNQKSTIFEFIECWARKRRNQALEVKPELCHSLELLPLPNKIHWCGIESKDHLLLSSGLQFFIINTENTSFEWFLS